MPGDRLARIFVSHASEDAEFALQVVKELEARDVPCWIARRDVLPSASYPVAIMEATQRAPALILILSKHASLSKHVPREVERADHLGKPLFTLKIDEEPPSKELEYFLSIRQQVNMIGGIRSKSMDKLAAQLKAIIPAEDADVSGKAESDPKAQPAAPHRRLRHARILGAAALAVAAAIGLLVWWEWKPSRGVPIAKPTRTDRADAAVAGRLRPAGVHLPDHRPRYRRRASAGTAGDKTRSTRYFDERHEAQEGKI